MRQHNLVHYPLLMEKAESVKLHPNIRAKHRILEGKVNLIQNRIWCCRRGRNDQRQNVSISNRVARHWVLVFAVWAACVCDLVPSAVLYLTGDCNT